MRNLLCSSIFLLLSQFNFAQENSELDYYIVGSDTIFCTSLWYSKTIQSYIETVNYVDLEGDSVSMNEKSEVRAIVSFHILGSTVDRVPQKANKPDKYVQWADRIVDGKLALNYYRKRSRTIELSNGAGGQNNSIDSKVIIIFYVKMPDGTYYDINKKSDRTKYIIPYLKKCKAFRDAYKGDYSHEKDEFIKTIELYNSLCE